jgi:hypothetical protein
MRKKALRRREERTKRAYIYELWRRVCCYFGSTGGAKQLRFPALSGFPPAT